MKYYHNIHEIIHLLNMFKCHHRIFTYLVWILLTTHEHKVLKGMGQSVIIMGLRCYNKQHIGMFTRPCVLWQSWNCRNCYCIGVWSECPSAWMPQSQRPYCLVAMPQSQSRNAPTVKSQCTHILEHPGRNATLLDGMPHFRDSRFLMLGF